MQIYKVLIFILVGINIGISQSYEVKLEPVHVDSIGGLQSFAIGTYEDDWLLVGGRLDGLHRRQPFAAFSEDGKNQELIVVNVKENKVWRAPLSSLPVTIAEQLSSTNMQFYQHDNQLFCTGGYGYSPTSNDHITFPYLTIIDLPKTINDVKNNSVSSSSFKQIENEMFRASGGALNMLDDVFYLVGGHNFMGRYNPMGPENGPGFFQEYTDEIRRFRIASDDDNPLEVLGTSHDELNLHRRDYNLVPYISNGEKKLMIYSGVFQNSADIPWLFPVSISKDDYEPIEDFTQYFNHYHCAHLPIYDEEKEEMHTIFFGGIAQFYEENDILVQDNDVPFVSTIADVMIDKEGKLTEVKMKEEMPGLLGAGSVLILDSEVDQLEDGIIDGSRLTDEYQHIGYIYGGIRSSLPNIFWINTGVESEASHTIYSVAIRNNSDVTDIKEVNERTFLTFYPNPGERIVRMAIDLERAEDLDIVIYDVKGEIVFSQLVSKNRLHKGRNVLTFDNVNIGYGAFIYTVLMDGKKMARKVIWSE